ncbi:NADP-dependent oxidoreductase [Bordetella petrii]|uniref:NADP-dependent oxidoreductase n=1 Tax=Bordetella petrii TaxID=94624 RepID=UPI001E39D4A3|nr:NADP-dependent oxidoreductase [Bordetella petrii]MCD0505540.1 NADP-dependent oxidoreductase [Bordetella petrii]
MSSGKRIVLASRPAAEPTLDNFRLESFDLADPAEGQVELRVLYLSLDPYMRGRMSDAKSYAPPVPIDGVMSGETVCEVTRSRHPAYSAGDLVRAHTGWCTHAVMKGDAVTRVDTFGAPVTTALGVLGMPGFTAYSGMKLIGQPKAGETVVVAAASGPVGSLVGQLAKLAGARAVGIAGGAQKCAYVQDTLGFDTCLDHRSASLAAGLAGACPDGIDVYFENVGGAVWDAVFPLLNQYARVPVCGLIAQYSVVDSGPEDRLPGLMAAILRRSLLVRGFINYEFAAGHYSAFLQELGPRVAAGDIKYREDIVDGFEQAPEAFIGMLAGKNFGKLIIRVA